MHLCYKSDELSTNTSIKEYRSNLIFYMKVVIDPIMIKVDACEMYCAFLDKNPFILLQGKPINEIQLSIISFELEFFKDLSFYTDKINSVFA